MINDPQFVYDAPDSLFNITKRLLETSLLLEKQGDMASLISNQMIFIVMIAVTVESHINWYYYFHEKIDISKEENKKSIECKLKNTPIKSDTKGGIKAIFKLRDDLVHIKYIPRKVQSECLYDKFFMMLSFDTLINLRDELISSCPETLSNQINVNSSEKELLYEIKLQDKTGRKINWVELAINGEIGLPLPNKVHIE